MIARELAVAVARRAGLAGRMLDVDVARQRRELWCWAACATAVSKFYDPASAWTQCGVANATLAMTTCCQGDPDCVRTANVYDALMHTANLGDRLAAPVRRRRLVRELNGGRPVVVRVKLELGHFLVVDGYRPWWGSWRIRVHDPAYPRTVELTLDALRDAYDHRGMWTHTYETVP
ncbi:C39 family peptidase [Candidatus Solirubrobacter pratensis]|uniref:C39 family peptidase n=1 Tax=Candidatus Solirubrobacter pratensis TaxID=1298857 RepID=UPI0004218D22|nr:papain-like cysteine protease family protein [Candidatus Solirubrobacter pratensis]